MTRRNLRRRLAATGVVLVLVVVVGLVLKVGFPDEQDLYEVYSDAIILVVTGLVAFMANAFQRRDAFVDLLRALWSHLIIAKNDVTSLTRFVAAGAVEKNVESFESRYEQVYASLSRAIDEMRGVYRNVGETDTHLGLYPFEPLHDMRRALEQLGEQPTFAQAQMTRTQVNQAWESIRFKFLKEFEAPEPTDPILGRGSRDPRRHSR